MGVVCEAEHVTLGHRVAIKFLSDGDEVSAVSAARFLREARAASNLSTPFVAKVMDVGTTDRGVPYLVMELLQGETLDRLIARRGGLPVSEAVGLVVQACAGIGEAHARGIIHRDLKPANLFLAKTPDDTTLKILDFGLAKHAGMTDAATTNSQVVFGTPQYMSPEQLQSTASVDPRTDVWAIGAILWELVVGRPAFGAPTSAHAIARVMTEAVPRPSDARRDLPAGFESIVMRALEKDPRKRYPGVAELARDLLPFAPSYRAIVQRIPPADESLTPPGQVLEADPNTAPTGNALQRRPRELVWPALGLAACLVAGLLSGKLLWRAPSSPPAIVSPIAEGPASPQPIPSVAIATEVPPSEPPIAPTPSASASRVLPLATRARVAGKAPPLPVVPAPPRPSPPRPSASAHEPASSAWGERW
jgi:serine/threonine-protein kinase